ncbi:hypothetical protein NDI54_00920 [Haloarcula sp. S1AR25-5A]|uniref:Uncharacterized protein n=1 Tax=Haloarcula terrestris TaxID=2950533 RepID=A0AAE4ETJ1_9EURY|nr:hypothetical protein [Haloarcula terrestris]MDS0219910.1 hypothetical protein [Haloarcula terrestris]
MPRFWRRWLFGAASAAALTAFVWQFLVTDPVLLSTFALTLFAATVALYTQRTVLPIFSRGGTWGGAFAGVTTYVVVTLQQRLALPSDRAFVVSLIVLGLASFSLAVGSALTIASAEDGTTTRD